ncbi:hypothetical protein, partial [Pseudomonas sp. ME-P-057]|uniref:hypothetical protein n=1 Tax=Pseudomonas sp. ME-P-057 TaxID=3040321 RepID=UPI002557AC96
MGESARRHWLTEPWPLRKLQWPIFGGIFRVAVSDCYPEKFFWNCFKKSLTAFRVALNMRPVHTATQKHAVTRRHLQVYCGAIAQLGERLHGMQEVSG